ncbi:6226_t:CDS:1, partial [Acaulospora colombiana]
FSLLALCLNANPVPRCPASVNLMDKLGNNITFTQSDESGKTIVTFSGEFKKGIDKNDPKNYYIKIMTPFPLQYSFETLKIQINIPATSAFSYSSSGSLRNSYIGRILKVLYNKDIIGEGKIESSSC